MLAAIQEHSASLAGEHPAPNGGMSTAPGTTGLGHTVGREYDVPERFWEVSESRCGGDARQRAGGTGIRAGFSESSQNGIRTPGNPATAWTAFPTVRSTQREGRGELRDKPPRARSRKYGLPTSYPSSDVITCLIRV